MALLGKKIGMTQIFDENGDVVPVTIVEVGPCTIIQKKDVSTDGYDAVQIGFKEKKEKHTTRAELGHFKKQNLKPLRFVKEFRTSKEEVFEAGQVLTVSMFQVGDHVNVRGKSKGKGFQGVIKRHHKAGGPASHGSRFHRTTGSIGQRTSPGEVFKNMKLPGHMGDKWVTVKGLKVVQVRIEENLMFIRGAIPGAKDGVVMISK